MDNGGTLTFTDASSGAVSWLWDFGDNNSSTQQNPVHTYSNPGNYTITLTINNGGCSSTQSFTILTGVKQIGSLNPKVVISPNPTSGMVSILIDKALEEDLQILVRDINGKAVMNSMLTKGSTEVKLNFAELSSAVYLVQIKGRTFSEVRKLIVG